jgi:putative hydrolase of the HAD superfamily
VPPPRAVLWDADGVLQRVPAGGEESMRPALGGRIDDVDGFLAQAFWEERPALRGEVRWLDVLPGLLARWGIGDAYDDVVRAWLSIEPVVPARDLVRAVRRSGVRCYLASNQDARRARFMQENLGYPDLLDGELYSCDLGRAKPDLAYFEKVLERVALSPGQVVFVDDNVANVEAARSLGMAAETWSYAEPADVLREHLARHGLAVDEVP